MAVRDPYHVLGLRSDASSEELHDAYRRMVKLHHPDHNGGSDESTRRFQEIQEAYDQARAVHAQRRTAPPPSARDASVASRMADLERELREAHALREQARRAAREAAAGPTEEELGHVSTDDSFGKILGDIREEVSSKLSDARRHPAVRRVSDLIDGLDDLTSRFDR